MGPGALLDYAVPMRTPIALFSLLAPAALAVGLRQDAAPGPLSPEEERLVAALAADGVRFDPARGLCSIPVQVAVRDELLEYLLVGPGGASHEAVFATDVMPSVLNAALLVLGAEPGTNAVWSPKEPLPTEEEMRAGVSPYDVQLPAGDTFFLYVAWREGEETFLYRIEDCLRNLSDGRSMERHGWVYLGSRMLPGVGEDATERFAADVYQNLINVSFFSDGYTLMTAALEACVEQTIWMPNGWLLPPRGASVSFLFARERLDKLPDDWAKALPVVDVRSPWEAEGR